MLTKKSQQNQDVQHFHTLTHRSDRGGGLCLRNSLNIVEKDQFAFVKGESHEFEKFRTKTSDVKKLPCY